MSKYSINKIFANNINRNHNNINLKKNEKEYNDIITGQVGQVGVTGATGRAGATGGLGARGPLGATGATGATGADSIVEGPKGEQGPQGPPGPPCVFDGTILLTGGALGLTKSTPYKKNIFSFGSSYVCATGVPIPFEFNMKSIVISRDNKNYTDPPGNDVFDIIYTDLTNLSLVNNANIIIGTITMVSDTFYVREMFDPLVIHNPGTLSIHVKENTPLNSTESSTVWQIAISIKPTAV